MNLSPYEKLSFAPGLRFHVCKYIVTLPIAVLHSLQQWAPLLPWLIGSHRDPQSVVPRERKYIPSLMPTFPISILFKTNSHKMPCPFSSSLPISKNMVPLLSAIYLFGSFAEFDRLQQCGFCPHPVGHTVTSASIVSPGERESGEWLSYWNVCGKSRDNLVGFITVIIIIIIHILTALAWHIRKVLENIYYTSGKWTWMWEVQTGICPIYPGLPAWSFVSFQERCYCKNHTWLR